MARFNEILAGRYNRFLQKLFQLKGGPPSAQLASEVMPVFPFFTGRENRVLEGWNTFAFARAQVAVAGITPVVRLRNPSASNVICIFERLLILNFNTTSAPILRSGPTNNDLPTTFVIGNKRLDPRGAADSQLITSENSGTGGALLQARMAGNMGQLTFFDFIIDAIGEIPLLPGDAIEMDQGGAGAGAGTTMSFLWRERALEDSEQKA